MSRESRPGRDSRWPLLFATVLCATLLIACGGGGATPPSLAPSIPDPLPDPQPAPVPDPTPVEVSFTPGPTPYAVEASLKGLVLGTLASVSVGIRTKPGNACADVHLTYPRAYLDTHAAISEDGTVTVTVFGLYADYDNDVEIAWEDTAGHVESAQHVVMTDPAPAGALPTLAVLERSAELRTNFLLVQVIGPPAIVDIDGEVRWRAPQIGVGFFPRACTPDGLVAGSMWNNGVFQIDWLGRVSQGSLSDPALKWSHHNISPGKTGFLDTVHYEDATVSKPESVLVEMTPSGEITAVWDFDALFTEHIASLGEDPAVLVQPGADWFHMNAAIYDASDDSILASSRENFVVKVDHATGAIRWILGNPGKLWYTAYPASLQPLALTLIGEPPVGQHAISVSPDGAHLLMFDNGNGNLTLPDVGDSRDASRVSTYRIDEQARTAELVWSFDFGGSVYCPTQSSAYWTRAGDVVIALTAQRSGAPDGVWIVDQGKDVRFRGAASRKGVTIYAAEEIRLEDFVAPGGKTHRKS